MGHPSSCWLLKVNSKDEIYETWQYEQSTISTNGTMENNWHFPHLENFGAMFTMEKKTDLYRSIVLFGQSRKPAYCNVISSKKVWIISVINLHTFQPRSLRLHNSSSNNSSCC